MKTILALAAQRKERLAAHPFFSWIRDPRVPAHIKLDIAPIMANFVMNFRDMNLWFIRFAGVSNQFEEVINGNTEEDETHSRLFIEDWRKLHLDEKLGWRASDTLWWLFQAAETEPFRGYAFDFARLAMDDTGDPLLRFAHSEAGEACGNAFFSAICPITAALRQQTQVEYRYFGDYHLQRERGHVIASEGIFDRQELDPVRREKGLALANAMFDIFFGMHDCFHGYARNYVERGIVPQRTRAPLPPMRHKPAGAPAQELAATGRNIQVQRVLEGRKARAARHPFYAWLQASGPLSPLHRLQRFIPMWVMDIMGYRDLNRYALRFKSPASPAERAFNRWVQALETHSALFLNDWDALGMDDALGWSASSTLEFLFLDPGTDVHRSNIARFTKLAIAHESPALRFWLLEALEASGEAFFANTRALAQSIERTTAMRLDYLADRHYLAHPEGEDHPARGHPFKSLPLGEEETQIAIAMVHTVFDAVDRQLTLSHAVATQDFFGIDSASHGITRDTAALGPA
ncbi:hypothetical protein [Comamonas antarctica]|uniref:Uncharacterized protein n=1 Tax=Comamonas antarctica TaxID=2743470 RepID=A0A6N1X9C8_9BURK|nr:hypothetical protein [Comamonas antarctica]QKV54436.1 hypothetical protein HUK68_16810 [Comamonas antarctica]